MVLHGEADVVNGVTPPHGAGFLHSANQFREWHGPGEIVESFLVDPRGQVAKRKGRVDAATERNDLGEITDRFADRRLGPPRHGSSQHHIAFALPAMQGEAERGRQNGEGRGPHPAGQRAHGFRRGGRDLRHPPTQGLTRDGMCGIEKKFRAPQSRTPALRAGSQFLFGPLRALRRTPLAVGHGRWRQLLTQALQTRHVSARTTPRRDATGHEIFDKCGQGPSVGDRVMDHHAEEIMVGPVGHHDEAVQRAGDQIERLREDRGEGRESRFGARGTGRKSDLFQHGFGRGADQLNGTHLARKDRGAQRLLAGEDYAESLAAKFRRERTADVEQRADIVRGIPRRDGSSFPQLALRKSERQQTRLAAGQQFLQPGARVASHPASWPPRRRGRHRFFPPRPRRVVRALRPQFLRNRFRPRKPLQLLRRPEQRAPQQRHHRQDGR